MLYSPCLISFLTNISRRELILVVENHEVLQRVAVIPRLAIQTIQSPPSQRTLRLHSSISGLWGHSLQKPPPLQALWQSSK